MSEADETSENSEKPPAQGGIEQLGSDVTGTLGTRVITMGFGLFTGIITARALGPENRGIFTLAALFPASLVTLSKFGQGVASIYFIRKEEEDVSQVASNVLWIALVTGIALVGIALALRETLLTSVLKGVPMYALLAVLPLAPILLIESYLYGVLQATDRFRVYNTRLLAEAVLTVTGMAVALLLLDLGLPGAFGVAVGIRTFMVCWVVWTIHKGSPLRFRFDFALAKRMFRYGLKSHVQIIASHFHFKAALYLVAYYSSPAQVAFYSIASRLAEHILWLPQSLGLALFPRLASSDEQGAHRMTAMAVRQALVLTAAAALALVMLGEFLITLWYGAEYAAAAEPLPYVAGGIVMMAMYVLLSRNFTSRNKQSINIIAAYIALFGNLGLNIMLIPKMGITGAAIATAVSYSTAAVLLLVFFLRDSGLPLHVVVLPQREDLDTWRRLFGGLKLGRFSMKS
jgi:O-antigen/teichoic acid export membrane protein